MATLQAAEVLVQGNQAEAIRGCCLISWLLDVAEEMCDMEEVQTILGHVISLTVQAVPVVLVTLNEGGLSLQWHTVIRCSFRSGRSEFKGYGGISSPALLAVFPPGALPPFKCVH
jgi:hypothetical protein